MRKIVIIDGSNLIFKSYYAVPPLNTSDGQPTNAVVGCLKSFKSTIQDIKPDYVLIVWDNGKPTFRHIQDPTYKAQRPPCPDELRLQFGIVQDGFARLGVPQIIAEIGMECDDFIGTVAAKSAEAGFEAIIVSADRDFYSLIRPGIKVYSFHVKKKNPKGDGLVDENYVRQTYECEPNQLNDIKCLTGEKSDNIQGVAGIGPKTATALIKQHGDIASLVTYMKKNPTAKNADKILNSLGIIKNAYQLAQIQTDLELPNIPVQPVSKIKVKEHEFRDFCTQFELQSFKMNLGQWINMFDYAKVGV